MEFFGYNFKNEDLLEEALTTPAFRMSSPDAKDNQRLEFLGDAVLGLLAAERLYTEFPKEQEGALTIRRSQLVSTAALCQAAERLRLGAELKRNRGAAPLPKNSKTLADAIEAIVGAAYEDGGYEAAKKVFETLKLEEKTQVGEWGDNPKGELQMKAQAMTPPRHPVYTLLETSGRAHTPTFKVRVVVDELGEAEASAGSRKEAEAQAAAKLLSIIGK